MWKCPKCNESVQDNSEGCPSCGASADAADLQHAGERLDRASQSMVSAFIASSLVLLVIWVLDSSPFGLSGDGIERALSVALAVLSCLTALVGLRLGMIGIFGERKARPTGVIGVVWNEILIAFWIFVCVAVYLGW